MWCGAVVGGGGGQGALSGVCLLPSPGWLAMRLIGPAVRLGLGWLGEGEGESEAGSY